MALIKCPECNHDVSDKAANCPKCGYEINGENDLKPKKNGSKKKFDYKTIIIIVLVGLGIWYFVSNKANPTTPGSSTGQLQTYTSSFLGLSFDYQSNYKIKEQDDNLIYIYEIEQNGKPAIPYVAVGRYDDYSNTLTFLNSFTTYIRKTYNNNNLSVGDLKAGNIGGKDILAISYKYTVSNVNINDYRYAMVINNKVYVVFSKTYSSDSEVMNDLASTVITSLSEVNK